MLYGTAMVEDQQFCLRWNNFQANIISHFETLRDNEDFTDVTIVCEGQRLQAHRVVLSACSPLFKDLFKNNPCAHPVIFMQDVEARHIVALLEFMYAGEVNIAQKYLSTFLKTAESLKIRGLTDTPSEVKIQKEEALFLNPQLKQSSINKDKCFKSNASCSSTVTSSQDISMNLFHQSVPPSKRKYLFDSETEKVMQNQETTSFGSYNIIQNDMKQVHLGRSSMQPKKELPDYSSDDDLRDDETDAINSFYTAGDVTEFSGTDTPKLHSLDPRPCRKCGRVYSNLSNLRQHMKLIHFPTFVKCPLCQKPFKTDLYLKRHLISSHGRNYFRSNMEDKFNNVTITNVRSMFESNRDVKYEEINFHNFCDTELTEGNSPEQVAI